MVAAMIKLVYDSDLAKNHCELWFLISVAKDPGLSGALAFLILLDIICMHMRSRMYLFIHFLTCAEHLFVVGGN